MKVRDILGHKGGRVVTIRPDASVSTAVHRLVLERIGALVVSEDGRRVAGIISERDIVRAVSAHGAEALAHLVSRHMTAKVETAREGDSLHELMEQMTNGKFRHVPVVEEGRLAGIISIGDVVKHRLAEMEAEARAMRDYISA